MFDILVITVFLRSLTIRASMFSSSALSSRRSSMSSSSESLGGLTDPLIGIKGRLSAILCVDPTACTISEMTDNIKKKGSDPTDLDSLTYSLKTDPFLKNFVNQLPFFMKDNKPGPKIRDAIAETLNTVLTKVSPGFPDGMFSTLTPPVDKTYLNNLVQAVNLIPENLDPSSSDDAKSPTGMTGMPNSGQSPTGMTGMPNSGQSPTGMTGMPNSNQSPTGMAGMPNNNQSPSGMGSNPFGANNNNPFGAGNNNPFGMGNNNPFGAGNNNPFGMGNNNPFGMGNNQSPFGMGNNNPSSPFGMSNNNNPFGVSNNPSPFGGNQSPFNSFSSPFGSAYSSSSSYKYSSH